jgi:hypothetical protein
MSSNQSRKICANHTDRPSTLLRGQIFPLHFSGMGWFFYFAPQTGFNWNESTAQENARL